MKPNASNPASWFSGMVRNTAAAVKRSSSDRKESASDMEAQPAAPTGAGDMFGGLSFKTPTKIEEQSSFGFLSAASAEPDGNGAEEHAPSAFNFLQASPYGEEAVAADTSATLPKRFDFIALDAPDAASETSFDFMVQDAASSAGQDFAAPPAAGLPHVAEAMASSSAPSIVELPVLSAPSPSVQAAVEAPPRPSRAVDTLPAVSTPLVVQPAVVRKKKLSGKRPGFAREEDVSANDMDVTAPNLAAAAASPVVAATPSPSTQHTPGVHKAAVFDVPSALSSDSGGLHAGQSSLLSGLTLYVPETDAAPPPPYRAPMESQALFSAPEAAPEAAPNQAPPPSTAPAPTAPAPTASRRDTFVHAAASFARTLESADASIARKAEERAECERKREELVEQMASWEREQNEAMQVEDFEAAERLQQATDQARVNVSELVAEVDRLRRQAQALEQAREALFSDQLVEVEKFADELELVSDERASSAGAFARQVEAESLAVARRLDEQAEAAREQTDLADTELRASEAEASQAAARISQGTAELRGERDEWSAKAAAAEDEVRALQALLLAKQAEREEFVARLSACEEEIAKFTAKYSARVAAAESQAATCRVRLQGLMASSDRVAEQRRQLVARQTAQENEAAGLAAGARAVKLELSVLESVRARMRREAAARRRRAQDAGAEDKAMAGLRDAVQGKRQAADASVARIAALQSELDAARADADGSVLRELEAQKAAAVAARNFKEAGRLAGEIKTVQARQQDSARRVEQAAAALEDGRAQLARCEQEVRDALGLVEARVRASELDKVRDLRAGLGALAAARRDLAALEAQDQDVVRAAVGLVRVEEESLQRRLLLARQALGEAGDDAGPEEAEAAAEELAQEHVVAGSSGEAGSGEAASHAQQSGPESVREMQEEQGQREEEQQPQQQQQQEAELGVAQLEALLEEAVAREDFEAAEALAQRVERAAAKAGAT